MSAVSGVTSLRFTPKHGHRGGQNGNLTPTQQSHENNGVQLTLSNVIGTTTSSTNAFDVSTQQNYFACSAGPAVILSQIDEHLHVTQRLFRAKYNISPINENQSYYNLFTPPHTPAKDRYGSPLKDRSFGAAVANSSDHASDSPGQVRASHRTREATCVSLSHEGRFLAVGETGYNPRVLIFSTISDALCDVPLSVLSDHSYGVASVAFSQDSRWLCTLGNSYDGFILVYAINPKTGSARLHFSNKCSNVTSVSWMGSNVISTGTRHVKVWRMESIPSTSPSKTQLDLDTNPTAVPESPTPKTFPGRNCLLGPLIDATFNRAVTISECKAILCTTSGEICLLDDTDKMQRLAVVAKIDFSVLCVTCGPKHDLLWIAGEGGAMRSMEVTDLIERAASPVSPVLSSHIPAYQAEHQSNIFAIGVVSDRIVTVSSDRVVRFGSADKSCGDATLLRVEKRLTAHESAVLGVRSLLPKATSSCPDFLTFASKGSVLFWMFDGSCTSSIEITLDQPKGIQNAYINELKSLSPSRSDGSLMTGDKNGTLRLTERSGNPVSVIQAHNGDVNGIVIAEKESLAIVASCGRDRTVQIFRKDDATLSLLQTLEDHTASVTDLMFSDGISTLLSISSDRTVSVRRMAYADEGSLAYICVRVITLKASPISLTCVPGEPYTVVVSTSDRQIQRYDFFTGRLLHSFKASDTASKESMMMTSLQIHTDNGSDSQARLLLGVSLTDKSIRIHDYDTGSTLAREYGQTTISAIRLIQGPEDQIDVRDHIISCGFDGTVMIWNMSLLKTELAKDSEVSTSLPSPLNQTAAPTRPIRRILSRAELSRFQKSLENDHDKLAPIRDSSPSRIQSKSSRFSLAPTSRSSNPPRSTNPNSFSSPANGRSDRKSSQRYPSKGSSPQTSPSAKAKRPSLEHWHRSKSAANLNDLSDAVEQMSHSLRTFRKRITSAATEKLDAGTMQELGNELELTKRAVVEKARKNQTGNETIAGDLLDVYLAKMIDERLALRAESDEKKKTEKVYPTLPDKAASNDVSAGAKEVAPAIE